MSTIRWFTCCIVTMALAEHAVQSQTVIANGTLEVYTSATSLLYSTTFHPPAPYVFKRVDKDTVPSMCKMTWHGGWYLLHIFENAVAISPYTADLSNDADVWLWKANGLLTCPGDDGSELNPPWAANVNGCQITILKMPQYIYADAEAAIPIQFRVEMPGDKVAITSLTVSFYADGRKLIDYDGLTTMAAGDGTCARGDSNTEAPFGNGTCKVYTVWVPTSVFRNDACDVSGYTVSDPFFKLTVAARATDQQGNPISIGGMTNDVALPACKAAVFGDRHVKVIDIGWNPTPYTNPQNNDSGFAKTWSINENASGTAQTRIHREATIGQDHMSPGHNSDWPRDPNRPPTISYSDCECLPFHPMSRCGMATWPFATVQPFNKPYHNWTSGVACRDTNGTQVGVKCELYQEWGSVEPGWKFRNKVTGETTGCYFGVSYGHRPNNIPVLVDAGLQNAQGMDLAIISGHANMYFCPDARLYIDQYRIGPAGDNAAGGLGMGFASSACSIGAALCTGGWSAALSIAAVSLALAPNIETPNNDGAVHCVGKGTWILKRVQMAAHGVDVAGVNSDCVTDVQGQDLSANMSYRDEVRVGDTWVGNVTLNCSNQSTTAYQLWKKSHSEIRYYLPAGRSFNSADSMAVSSAADAVPSEPN